MKMRSAILTGVTGLMLNIGLGSAVNAQPAYRYRNNAVQGRHAMNGQGQVRQMVRQAYRDILRREPDASGLRQYTDAILNRGWSDADLRRSLMESPEYAQRFGSARSGWQPYR
jgi:hypothetical protein